MSDHLGSTSAVADANGNLLSSLRYTAFGELRAASGTISTDYRYTGQRNEAEIGLYYYGARWYDSGLSRFIQADTIVPEPFNPLDWDKYSYGLNNPSRYTDPTGHFACGDGIDDSRCDQFDPPTIPNIVSPQPSSSSPGTGNNNWDLINSNPYYLFYWPYLMFPQNGPCLGGLGCWGGIDYAHFGVRVNGPYFDQIVQGYLSDMVVLWGFNGSANVPGIYNTGGLEEIVIFKDKTRATYNYGGQGSAAGAGASAAAYFGLAANVKSPEDYRGISASVGLTVSVLDVGLTASYFWNGDYAPLTPGVVQGFQLGYAPGAQASIWWSSVIYNLNWTSK